MAQLVTVIYNEEKRGKGVEGDPVRLVPQYFQFNGDLIFERDPTVKTREELEKALAGEKANSKMYERYYDEDLRTIEALKKRITELEDCIRWACGEKDFFRERAMGEGFYWWRDELRARAKLPALKPAEEGQG